MARVWESLFALYGEPLSALIAEQLGCDLFYALLICAPRFGSCENPPADFGFARRVAGLRRVRHLGHVVVRLPVGGLPKSLLPDFLLCLLKA